MQNIFIDILPPWVETGLQPAFYDLESGTVLQQTARMYARVNELTNAFNKFSQDTTDFVNNFVDETNAEIERFEQATNDEIERFEGVVNDTVEEYIQKFNDLHDYVEDYFDNLDVQQEINNKLDQMAEAGTLADIIAAYLNSIAVFGYDTVASMKSSENLISGSYAHTLGYYSFNDGGEAYYKIRNRTLADTPDDMFIVAVGDSLIAELVIPDMLSVKQVGIQEDVDVTSKLTTIFTKCKRVYFPAGNYLTDTIELPEGTYIKNDGVINSCDDDAIFYINDADNVVIEGGEYKGENSDNTQSLIKVNDSNYCIFKDMKLSLALNKCIEIYGASSHNTIDNVSCSGATATTGAGIALHGENVKYNTIKNVYTSGNRIGITLNSCSHNNVDNVKSYQDNLMGITIDGTVNDSGDGGSYNTISNVNVDGIQAAGYGGIYVGNGSHDNNFNNIVITNSSTSPAIKQTHPVDHEAYGNKFENITVYNCKGGMMFTRALRGNVTNFSLDTLTDRGIYLNGCEGSTFSNGLVKGSTSEGIFIQTADCNFSNINVIGNNEGIELAFGGSGITGNNFSNIQFKNNTTNQFVPVSTYTINNTTGYVANNQGVASKSNTQTIAHGLGKEPTVIVATSSVAGHNVCVTSKSSSTFTISLTDASGTAVTTPENIYWYAHI
jgi:hypothetical protein